MGMKPTQHPTQDRAGAWGWAWQCCYIYLKALSLIEKVKWNERFSNLIKYSTMCIQKLWSAATAIAHIGFIRWQIIKKTYNLQKRIEVLALVVTICCKKVWTVHTSALVWCMICFPIFLIDYIYRNIGIDNWIRAPPD